ncbi:hypothetical protein FIV00_15100 [Labrenzia sp. THAF82]|uniref:hypothetical protein n=1 Tax=Labrenzia sp. THAF82 TaxID=2587861 RepID=UPI001268B113|nr:hypothetical protein [Labrenzia sp. THAF82]QFT31818.1 hypothetical protein FIV00_15100 [Labrenzia sp. THAF82]
MGIYNEEQIAVLATQKARAARAWEVRFASETLYIWNGNVDRKLHDDNTYQGLRGQLTAPDFSFSGKAENETGLFQIRGLPGEIEEMIWDEKAEVFGRYIIEHFMLLTADDLTLVGPAVLSQIYVMRGVQSDQEGATAQGQPNYTLNLMVESLFSQRSEAGFGRYTQADQKGRYPSSNDKMFNYVPILARGKTIQLV